MPVENVHKRNGSVETFDKQKIINAIEKAMRATKIKSKNISTEITDEVLIRLVELQTDTVEVDVIHKLVENVIMDMGFHNLAREYIVYRATNMPDIFRKRVNLKPYEYPQLIEYLEAIRHSYWIHTEFNYSSDVQDIKIKMTESESDIVKRSMLAISQIEVQVKSFWAKLGDKLQKPELQAIGVTFGESEVRHADAYSNLLEILGLNKEFETLVEVPAIKKRISYLENSIKSSGENKDYFQKIILFSLFVENVSLFSQFLIMMSFNKHKNLLKGISNAVEATSKEEDVHARFGFELVNIIKKENPTWWDKETIAEINASCREAYKAELAVIDWIYGNTELDFMPKQVVKEFLKHRFNKSMNAIGIKNIFEVDEELVKQTNWFDEEILSTKNVDFFVKRSTSYSKKTKSYTEEDLF